MISTRTSSRRLNRWAIGCVALSLAIAAPAWAGYTPPSQLSAPSGGTTTTGRRGSCQGDAAESLTALAPRSHVGQTVATRPTFAWFVAEAETLPIEFQLYQATPNGDEQLIYQAELQSTSGIMSLALPQTQPALNVGQRYRWQVILFCNPNNPSSALVSEAELEIIPLDPPLETSLLSAADAADRANLFAGAGLWYDAIALVLDDSTLRPLQLALLSDLAQVEAERGSGDRSRQLQRIIQQAQ